MCGISVFAIFCLAVGIAPSFALPSQSNQNHKGLERTSSGPGHEELVPYSRNPPPPPRSFGQCLFESLGFKDFMSDMKQTRAAAEEKRSAEAERKQRRARKGYLLSRYCDQWTARFDLLSPPSGLAKQIRFRSQAKPTPICHQNHPYSPLVAFQFLWTQHSLKPDQARPSVPWSPLLNLVAEATTAEEEELEAKELALESEVGDMRALPEEFRHRLEVVEARVSWMEAERHSAEGRLADASLRRSRSHVREEVMKNNPNLQEMNTTAN
ncbi:hypothetical protein F5148DRAFT_1371675 [Russula earlei]|uniref:Uncharacterized protein n=1 Tax=Russula earlei TaxID=71964 RepID=A0ACC0TSC7_9AGAM|nr:hypothetical protein F5148DRAFT_1371675 [Russula earlei]